MAKPKLVSGVSHGASAGAAIPEHVLQGLGVGRGDERLAPRAEARHHRLGPRLVELRVEVVEKRDGASGLLRARLYTEMITTGALLFGDADRFLRFDPAEHPVALQLGAASVAPVMVAPWQ